MIRGILICLTAVYLGIGAVPPPRTIVAARDEAVPLSAGSEFLLSKGSRVAIHSPEKIEITGTAFLKAPGTFHVLANGREYRLADAEVAFFPDHVSVYAGSVDVSDHTLRTGERMIGARRSPISPSTRELDWIEPFRVTKRPPLITSDAGGMTIKRQVVRISTDGPIIMTQIHFTFHNSTDRRAEGRMKFPLPADASISRLALKIGDRWMEGEFVEKQKARETFEAIVRSMRDPALLEQQEGNIFELRIFPFDPKGDRELILSYTQTLSSVSGMRYRLPLPVGQTIGEFSLRASLPGAIVDTAPSTANLGAIARMAQEIKVDQNDFTPDRDFTMEISAPRNILSKSGQTMIARATPALRDVETINASEKWLILVDVSASMIENSDLLRKTVSALTERLPRNGTARIAFLREGIIEDNGAYLSLESDRKQIYSHANRVITDGVFLGGSNFSAAATFIAESGADRVIFVTDGVSVLGPDADFKASPRIDVITPASGGDPDFLGRLTRKTGGVVLKLNRGEEDEQLRLGVVALLGRPTSLSAHLIGESGEEVSSYGGERRPAFAGDEFVLAAQSEKKISSIIFRDEAGGTAYTVPLEVESVKNEQALCRAYAHQKIRSLISRGVDEDLQRAVREEVVRLSREWRIISPYTSLLTLENEYDYTRWGIERDATAPVLVIEDGAIITRIPEKPEFTPPPVRRIRPWQTMDGERMDRAPLDLPAPSPSAAARSSRPEMSSGTAFSTGGAIPEEGENGFSPGGGSAGIPRPIGDDVSNFISFNKVESVADTASREEDVESLEKIVRDNPLDRAARGRLVKTLIARDQTKKAIAALRAWIPYDPDNVGLSIQLVELYESVNEKALARRAAESVADRLPGAFDARAYLAAKYDEWGEHEEALRQWKRARDLRPEVPSVHLSYARSLLIAGRYEEAERALLDVVRRQWDARFGDIDRLASAEFAVLYLKWKQSGDAPRDIDARQTRNAKPLGSGMWIFLTWNTDGTDVDLHVTDPRGEHVSYNNRKSSSGGELLEDLTEGFGPELFAAEHPLPGEYVIAAHYYSQRVQGPTRGQVTIVLNAGLPTQRIITKPFLLERQGEMVEVTRIRP